jgi:signal transduction histidine kinase
MSIRWWQSIRWRLALGSVLVTLLAMSLLTLTAILAIVYYYEGDQKAHMNELAASRAQQMGVMYTQQSALYTPVAALRRAAIATLPQISVRNTQDQQYLMVVLDSHNRVIYPATTASMPNRALATFLLRLVDPARQVGDYSKLHTAIVEAQGGIPASDELGKGLFPQPFVAEPIYSDGQSSSAVVGVLLVTPRSAIERTIPPFITTAGSAILIAALIVTVIAAGAAILFSRTITRPLAQLTKATRVLASGDYETRVETKAQGEMGELAHNFNEMAAQLSRDVEELHKQELWRRELIMSITHDLATPLTAIAGLGESLVDGVNQSREDYEATGRVIVRETLRLRRLVKDLHTMAKVEAGALQPQCQPVRLAALVDQTLAALAPELERARVEPRNAIPYNLPPVQADADMLTRVFSNLCDNALRYTPAGGVVTIEARQQGGEMAVAVSDTGKGIPPEALSRIFERFFRADSARQSTMGGSGLGLAIVRAIIEAHGGRVWAENRAGGGARIIFTLPLQPAGQSPLSNATTQPLWKSGEQKALPLPADSEVTEKRIL